MFGIIMCYKINIHTDGACSGNPGPGGYCAIIKIPASINFHKEISGKEKNTTNNRMELKAAIEGLKHIKNSNTDKSLISINLYSDSQYVIKGASEWIKSWIKKDFKDIKNPDLWKEFISVSEGLEIDYIWVKGHNGDEFNEMCDSIAQKLSKS
jgi:ribonuclease HI